jgi:PKD repeat protein
VVNDLPSSTFTFEPLDPVANKDVLFSTVGAGSASWLWNFGDGTTSTEQNPTHVFEELGDYVVTLTSTSIQECSSTSSVSIGVITGTEQSIADSFEIYPNPVVNSDKLIVRLPQGLPNTDASFYNSQGSRLQVASYRTDNQITLDVSPLPNGIYLLKVRINTTTVTKKIAITR